jgi:hypothetical protein
LNEVAARKIRFHCYGTPMVLLEGSCLRAGAFK